MDFKKFLLLGTIAIASNNIIAATPESDPDVSRLLTAVKTAGFEQSAEKGLLASINGAKASGAKGIDIEERAKQFYLEGCMKKFPSRAEAMKAVDKTLPLIEYARKLIETV